MRPLLAIAAAEWRCWQRSRLALAGALLLAALLLATTVLTLLRMDAEARARAQQQAQAEAAFLSQPARHPHRMVHYGHYVFRTPPPLAGIDPGLDPVTGQSIFLEGHRQNTAMFAESGAGADLGALSALTPAHVYQWFAPLLLILLGHGLVAREREAATLATLLAQGTSGRRLLAGKALALASVVLVLLLPLAVGAAWAVRSGEEPAAAGALLGAYLLYLAAWGGLCLLASALLRRRSASLLALVSLWIAATLVLPAAATSWAAGRAPVPGALDTELAVRAELRQLADGHDANAPAFDRLRADLLARHGVRRVEDLPVNLRGVVAQQAEQTLTEALNRHAEARLAAEADQAESLAQLGWLTPLLAIAEASRAVAGTDLAHHHRFLRQAETLRYDFVQGLNRLHAEKLAYGDDVRRSRDAAAEGRTRVDAAHWQLLDRFVFTPEEARRRIDRAGPQGLMLGVWCGVLATAVFLAGGRLRP